MSVPQLKLTILSLLLLTGCEEAKQPRVVSGDLVHQSILSAAETGFEWGRACAAGVTNSSKSNLLLWTSNNWSWLKEKP